MERAKNSVLAIVGAGVMGKELAVTAALHGFTAVLHETSEAVMESAVADMRRIVRRYCMLAQPSSVKQSDVLERISVTSEVDDLRGSTWLVENIVEEWAAKEACYHDLRSVIGPDTLVVPNTSCISITRIGSLVPDPTRVIGMHFMNPVSLSEIVEVIVGIHTSAETTAAAQLFAQQLGKEPIVVQDSPGFVSNRLSHLFMNEAAFLVQERVADPAAIDAIFTGGYRHQMGPLATADLIGLDTVVRSLDVLFDDLRDPKFRCCPLLRRMVDAGRLGRKSGHGFFDYRSNGAEPAVSEGLGAVVEVGS